MLFLKILFLIPNPIAHLHCLWENRLSIPLQGSACGGVEQVWLLKPGCRHWNVASHSCLLTSSRKEMTASRAGAFIGLAKACLRWAETLRACLGRLSLFFFPFFFLSEAYGELSQWTDQKYSRRGRRRSRTDSCDWGGMSRVL